MEVIGAASITTNGGAVDLSFADADSLLNGNGTAPVQTGSVAADVTVTDDIIGWPMHRVCLVVRPTTHCLTTRRLLLTVTASDS